jgi:hypothetical protein
VTKAELLRRKEIVEWQLSFAKDIEIAERRQKELEKIRKQIEACEKNNQKT